jgi:hypothetical protein
VPWALRTCVQWNGLHLKQTFPDDGPYEAETCSSDNKFA